MMDFKSTLKKEAEKAILKKTVGKILPMDEAPKPKLGKKAKLAALLGTIAAIAAAGAQYLGG
jgi:hypothetical protein